MPGDSAISNAESPIVTPGERALVVLTLAGLAIIPCVIRTGVWDYFRPVKEIAFRAEAILAVFCLGLALAYGGAERLRELLRERLVVALTAATLLWAALAAFLSTNRAVSLDSFVTVACSVALFVAVWYASRSVPLSGVLVLVPVVLLNAIFMALQEYRIWQPFHFTVFDPTHHVSSSALLGNPNDIGAYFTLCMIVLLGAAPFLKGWQRWAAALAGLAALAGVLIAQARTAAIAMIAVLFVFAIRRSVVAGIAILLLAAGTLVAASFTTIPAFTRLVQVRHAAERGEWNVVTSERLVPFLTAYEMYRERPLTGQGPGTFKALYLHERLGLGVKYPEKWTQGTWVMFGETHNDHLQLLAEGGIPAYVLFLAALVALVPWRRMRDALSPRARTALTYGWPVAVAVFILALAFFPLQIALTRHLLITVAALIVGWRQT